MSWLGGVGILHCLAQARPYRPLVWSGSHQSCGCPVAAFDPAVLLPDPRVSRLLDPLGRPAISISMDVQDCSDGARGGVEIKSLSLVLPTRGPSLHLRLRGRPLRRKLHLCCRHAHNPQQVPVVPLCNLQRKSTVLLVCRGLYLRNELFLLAGVLYSRNVAVSYP